MEDAGHAEKFRALVLPELAYLRRLGLALTGSAPAADDLVQETVLRALRYFKNYRGDGFRPWMAAIMRNVNRDRPMKNVVSAEDAALHKIPDAAPDPEQQALVRDNSQRLRALVAGLPETLREVLIMREFGGLSYAQIAAALDIPAGTVMSRLSRARDDLRAAWRAGEDRATS